MSQEAYLKSLSAFELRSYLENNASATDQGKYSKPLTDEELSDCKSSLADNSIKLSDLKEDFDEVKKAHKEKCEPYMLHNKVLLTEIRSKQRLAAGIVYHLPNFTDGFMESYNQDGEFLDSRKLRPDEKQGVILAMAK